MTLRNELNNPRWEVLTAALLKTQILAEVTPEPVTVAGRAV